MNNKVILFFNGEVPTKVPNLSDYKKIYCTDGSYNYLKTLGIKPDVITGDFDSINITTFPADTEIIITPDQNYTDFEKVLQIIVDQKFNSVDVFGASGKQQDHFLGNLNAAYKFKSQLAIQFFDNYSTYYFLNNTAKIKTKIKQKVSLVPFPIADGIITEGLMYPLKNESLDLIGRLGTRNEAISEEITIEFKTGDLLIYLINRIT